MKKIVYINFRQLHREIGEKNGFIDRYLYEEYELKCIGGSWNYTVEDESKFSLFMLKYSDYIDEITYE